MENNEKNERRQENAMETSGNNECRQGGRWWLYGGVLYLLTLAFSFVYAMLAHWSGDFWQAAYLVSSAVAFSVFSLLPLLLPL